MILSLIFLPVRIAMNLIGLVARMAFGLAWLPIKLVTSHLLLTILVIFAVLVLGYCQLRKEEKAPTQLPKTTTPSVTVAPQLQGVTTKGRPQAPVKIDPVLKVEDGNSAFASDLYKAMTDAERAYYSQLFFWVMGNITDGKPYVWNYGNINGAMTPLSTFQNKRGGTCRKFKETLKVHTVQQTLDGTACYQGGNSWCKLKVNATPACGLGGKDSTFDGIQRSLKNLF